MIFDVIALFPEVLKPYLSESIMGRATRRKLFKVNFYDLRDFSSDRKYKRVDDRVYGGGPGMVIQAGPVVKAVEHIKNKSKKSKTKVVILSPAGIEFNDKLASSWSKNYERLILICGRYEGIDERVKKVIGNWKLEIENLSIGPYVLSGGELAALIIIDAVGRKVSGVLGKAESLEEKRLGTGVPVYTRPEVFLYRKRKYSVPKVLLSGDHKKISDWRLLHRKTGEK